MNIHRYMQPVDKTIGDLLVRADDGAWVQTDKDGKAHMKPLWANPGSGGWAVLYRWQKGYQAPAHKHLGAIHAYIISGCLKLRDTQLKAGDYMYEANGIIHDETVALEDTVHLNIADGPILFFDDSAITHYVGWEQIQKLLNADSQSREKNED